MRRRIFPALVIAGLIIGIGFYAWVAVQSRWPSYPSPSPASSPAGRLVTADRPEAPAIAERVAEAAPVVAPTATPAVPAPAQPRLTPPLFASATAAPSPAPTPPANPQLFLRVTVEGAPALNCGSPIDCEASYAYAMTTFHVGDRLPYTRILVDARGQRFYILGPWTPVGLLPVGDAVPLS